MKETKLSYENKTLIACSQRLQAETKNLRAEETVTLTSPGQNMSPRALAHTTQLSLNWSMTNLVIIKRSKESKPCPFLSDLFFEIVRGGKLRPCR